MIPPISWQDIDIDVVELDLPWKFDLACGIDAAELAANIDLVNLCKAAATDALYVKTGSRYAVYTETIVPHARCADSYDLMEQMKGALITLDEVKVAGSIITATDNWYVRNGRYLIPITDGALDPWPKQYPHVLVDGPNTWTITLTHGKYPPALVLLAAGELACQLYQFFTNKPCDIPSNSIAVTREGITVTLETGLKSLPICRDALEVYGSDKPVITSRITDPSTWHEVSRL